MRGHFSPPRGIEKGGVLKRRVVVTGLGLVLPNGIGVEQAWRNTCEGKSGIGRITRFDASQHETKIAGEIKDFCPEDYLERKEIRRMDLFIQYAVAHQKWRWRIPGY